MNGYYLNKAQSETIKGILIILIVIGHSHILCPNTVSGGMMDFLYHFHVAGFFILPFFYQNRTELSWRKVGRIVVRCWVPYLWICLLCWMVFSIYSKHFDFGWGHVAALINGTQSPIRHYFGFVFPWFLPTYCSFSLLLLIARKSRILYLLFFIIGLGTFFMTWNQFYQFKNTVPLGLGLAVNYFASGVIAFAANKLSPYAKYVGAVVFPILSVCWWLRIDLGICSSILMPVSFFLFLLCIVDYLQLNVLREMGRYSLGIYLFHMFLINGLERLLPHSFIWGWVIVLLSLILSFMLVWLIYHIAVMKKILFPSLIVLLGTFLLQSCERDEGADMKVCFIGDSMVANWDVEACFPNRIIENQGIDGIGIAQLTNMKAENQTAVVLIGTNDLSASMNDSQIKAYCDLFEKNIVNLNAVSTIVVSVLPTSNVAKNVAIRKFNDEIKLRFASYKKIDFVDCYDIFSKDEVLRKDLERDGLHLNDYGYRLLTDQVKEKL